MNKHTCNNIFPPFLLNKAISTSILYSTKTLAKENILQVSVKKLEVNILIHPECQKRTLLVNKFIYYKTLLKNLESAQTSSIP